MTVDGKIRDEKRRFHINREAAKTSALSSGKIHECEYLTCKEVLEQAKFTYSLLGKAFEKQTKIIEE